MLTSRLRELSDTEILKQDTQGSLTNTTLKMDNIIDAVIAKYSKSTGAVATFLVKDTVIHELTKICTSVTLPIPRKGVLRQNIPYQLRNNFQFNLQLD